MQKEYDQSVSSIDISNTSDDSINDALQSKYSNLSSYTSRIPVKTRQFSAPIQLLDESIYGTRYKKSSIPRIASTSNFSLDPNLTTTFKDADDKKRKTLSPIDSNLNSKTDGSKNLSPMNTLSAKISSLRLDSPRFMNSSTPIYSPKIRKATLKNLSNTGEESKENIRLANNSSLKERTADSVHSRYEVTNNFNNKDSSYSKRNVSLPKARKMTPSKFDDSPLFQRLTRSTTASNLKAEAKKRIRVTSESPSKVKNSNISRSIPSKNISSELINDSSTFSEHLGKPTRSSQLRQEAIFSVKNTQSPTQAQSKLLIPKKRMLKSYTINNGLSDLTHSPPHATSVRKPSIPKQILSKRIPSRSITSLHSASTSSSSRGSVSKLKTKDELFNALISNPRTEPLIKSWNKPSSFNHASEIIPSNVLTDPNVKLSTYEKAEILKISEIYYISSSSNRSNTNYLQNFGFDDKDKNLKVNPKDHINYRYEVIAKLGKGMFGNVLKCSDHKLKKIVGVKIMKNDVTWSLQSINEIKILKSLQGHENVLKYYEHFSFRSHICVSTELLAVNLLEALESVNFEGFHIDVIKNWSMQLLSGLEFIHSNKIIHADLKPENIMLTSPNSFDLRIIDFGSSCHVDELTYPYIQSRFYRAPEVVLGCHYDTKIDIWSFITLIYEMYTGKTLFPAHSESDLFNSIVKLVGQPSHRTILDLKNDLLEKGSVNKHNDITFLDKGSMIFTKFDRLGRLKATSSTFALLSHKPTQFNKQLGLDQPEFVRFLQSGLTWNYKHRPSATDLLQHKFLK